jgi:hypothetical protein
LAHKAASRSRNTGNKSRSYKDLLDGRFDTKVVRIELGDYDDNDILGKAFDFSSKTIDKLTDRGYRDASSQI